MAVGILAALHARQRTGEGQKIVVSMQEAVLGFMISSMHEYFTGIQVGHEPVQVADGYFTLRMPQITDAAWPRLARLIGRDDLIEDPRFTTAAARRQHQPELQKMVAEWARTKTRKEIWEGLRDLGYFGAPVLSTSEVLEDPHIKARKAFIERDHPTAGPIKLLAPWIHLSKTPAAIRYDAPALGQHTDEVLGGILGLSAAELGDLRTQGIVK
jgi:crotonobetainyl-CoA:carnitine CoA-transferase CaiB-like acyl-CoA transferase